MVTHYGRNALFAAIGVGLLAISSWIDAQVHPMAQSVLFNLGIVTVSVTLLDVLWRLAGGDPLQARFAELSEQVDRLSRTVDVMEGAKRIGLCRVHDCAGNYGAKQEWLKLMENATRSMDLMGRTLHEWIRAPELDQLLRDKVERDGVTFRWLLMSPDNEHRSQLEEDGEKIGESLSKKIDQVCQRLTAIRSSIAADKQGRLQVKLFTRVPLYCSLLRVDDQYLVTPYLQSVGSRNSPLICIQGDESPWAITYAREFDAIWNTADDYFRDAVALPSGRVQTEPNSPG